MKVLVDGNKRIEGACHGGEQGPVIQITPSHLGSVPYVESEEITRQALGNAGVEEHPQKPVCHDSLRSSSSSEESRLRRFENGDRMLARHRGEVHQEVIQ